VSFGEKEFQTKKVANSAIDKFIPNIIITDSSKAIEIRKILEDSKKQENEKMYFLDDRTEQIEEIKKEFPEMITILVKRPEGRYQEMQKEACCDFQVHNLKEAQEIIAAELKSC
jgi:hypothetical protein